MRRWLCFPLRMKRLTSSIAVRLREFPAGAVVLTVAAWASFGCDSFSFVPPQPEELRGKGGATPVATSAGPAIAPAPTRSIDFVLGPHEPDEAEVWKTSARAQAGLDKAKLKLIGPAEPPRTQAELVREALAHDPRVLVIDSAGPDDPPLLKAIEQARSQGIPVILVGPPPVGAKAASATGADSETVSTTSPGPRAPLVSVAPKPFSVSAKQLVSAGLRHANYAGIEPGKSAIIVVNTAGDSYLPERTLAIKEALKAAGITAITEARFATEMGEAEKAWSASLKAHPETVLTFPLDSVSSSALRTVMKNNSEHRFFIASCYIGESQVADLTGIIQVAAVAEFTPTRLMRKAIATASALAQGRDVLSMVEYPINVSDSIITPAFLKSQALQWNNAAEAAKAKK
jgi:ABC-type sugar transport system substrate-binding protein